MNSLEKLLYLRGVAAEYINYAGERVCVPCEDRLKILESVGYRVQDDEAIQQAIFELDALPWKSWLRPFNVVSLGGAQHFDIRVHPDELSSPFNWQITTGTGEHTRGKLIPGELPETGDYTIDGVRYCARRQPLTDLPMGYHQITLSNQREQVRAVLAVAPGRCFEGNDDGFGLNVDDPEQNSDNNMRWWGINCQLYTLRSSRNWGIGDFTDLMELIELGAAAGADLVGLNPLHAPQLGAADFASPYSPSDRRFLNPLYIDPERVQDFCDSDKVRTLRKSRVFQRKLSGLRASSLVDYDGVAALKYWVFEEIFRYFREHHLRQGTARGKSFHNFVRRQGESLRAFSQHEAEHSGLSAHSAGDARFHQYLQWLADEQLEQCQALAIARGMKVGLMRDLAVGAVRGGAEVEGKQALFCAQATIGAPPDSFAREGQNWNLPALDPIALQQDSYRHFIQLLRSNMSRCGALRIDHVMGLQRLWWCLPDTPGGAYVYYPVEDLLAILRLESHRNRCLVIGEDMGVVPAELRATMAATAVYSNKLFYFEREHDQQFKLPRDHQEDALLMVTNHDVATLAGWWNGTDLQIRSEIGQLDTEAGLPGAVKERRKDKIRLLDWLRMQELLPKSWAEHATDSAAEKPFDSDLCGAILKANARSRSRMMLFQMDDLQLLEEPVNIPGTCREYPNWRRKQGLETRAVFEDPQIRALLASIDQERRK